MKRAVCFLCIAVLMIGLPLSVGATPAVSDVTAEPYTEDSHDIAVMSFNILAGNSGEAYYASAPERYYRVLTVIEKYDPDVIGIQEASHVRYVDAAGKRPWDTALLEDLDKMGYGGVCITEENGVATTTGQGMMIFYKKDRFAFDKAKQDHGWLNLNTRATYNGITAKHGQDRALQWLELIDTAHNDQSLYIFNTHLAINVSKDINGKTISDSAVIRKISNDIRTQQAAAIATKIKEKAANTPFFATGDYNSSLAVSYEADEYIVPREEGYNQLAAMPAVLPSIADAALTARLNVNADIYSLIDHIFYNSDCQTVRQTLVITENVDGRHPSDHFPVLTYANYRAALKKAPAGYDPYTGTVVGEVTGNTAALQLTPVNSNYTVELPAMDLPRYQNDKEIKIYYKGALFDTLQARLIRTDAPLPALTAVGAENCYFAKGSFYAVLKESTDTLTLSVPIYSDAACTSPVSGTLKNIGGGVTHYYIKHTTGEVFPLLICKETAAAADNTFYLGALPKEGVGAFVSGDEVILAETGVNGAATLEQAAVLSGTVAEATLRIAPGHYQENTTNFTKNITILGPNADTEAICRVPDGEWVLNPARDEEAVIEGAINFSKVARVTVKGLSFEGLTKQGSISLSDSRGPKDTSHYVIENNIFRGSAYRTNGAAVYMNNSTQKSGSVKGNAFICTANRVDYADTANSRYYRGIFGRNANVLTVEENLFLGIRTPLWLSAEVQSGNITDYGYAVYTVQDNRFAYCGSPQNAVRCIGGETKGEIVFRRNDFILCNKELYAMGFNLTETKLPMDCSKLYMEISDNRFIDCITSVSVSGTLLSADLSKATLRIVRNRFIYPTERHPQQTKLPQTFRLIFNTPDKKTLTLDENTTWDFSHNYFVSAYLVKGDTVSHGPFNGTVPDINDPQYFVENENSNAQPTLANAADLFAPYYTDYDMKNLVGEHRWESDYRVDREPTCGVAGQRSIHCATCSATKEAEPIPATERHTESDVQTVLSPTCSQTGLGRTYCTACSTPLREEILLPVDPNVHNWQTKYTVDTPATCGKAGSKSYHCGDCNAKRSVTAIPATGAHNWDDGRITKQPTASKTGVKTYTCSVCGTTKTETVAKLPAEKPGVNFTDVKKSDFYYDAVQWAVELGVTTGTSKTAFGPSQACTRAQAVTFLWRAAGQPTAKNAKNPFTDVKKSDYFYKAVLWAAESGVTSGVSKTSFAPNATCTRGQIVTFLWRAQGAKKVTSSNPFTDVKKSDFYYDAVLWAVKNNVTAGMSKTTFAPSAKCTRGQIVTFLYRAVK